MLIRLPRGLVIRWTIASWRKRTVDCHYVYSTLLSLLDVFVKGLVYERSEFYIVIGARIVEEIEVKAEYMGGLADRILRCR